MASASDSEGKDDLMDLSPFMQNFVLKNPFSTSGLISSSDVEDKGSSSSTPSQLRTGYVGSNVQYAVSLKKQWLAPKHHPVRQWLKKEFTECSSDRVSADLVYREAIKRFPNLSPQLLTRIVRATFPNVNKVPTRRGCTFQGMADKLKKTCYSLESNGILDTSVTHTSHSVTNNPPDGDTDWWGSEDEDQPGNDTEWTPPSGSQKDHTPSKRWNLRKRNHSSGSVSSGNIKRQFFARSVNKAKAVLRSKNKNEIAGSPKFGNTVKESLHGGLGMTAQAVNSVESSSVKYELCQDELLSALPVVDNQDAAMATSRASEKISPRVSESSRENTSGNAISAQFLQTEKQTKTRSRKAESGVLRVKEEPLDEEDGYTELCGPHPAQSGDDASSDSVVVDLQKRVTEMEAQLNTAHLQCQTQALRNEQLMAKLVKANTTLQHRNSQVAALGAQFLDLSNQFNKISHQFQVLLFDIQSEEGSTCLQNGS